MKIYLLLLIFIFIIKGCSSLQLTPADFSWPIETVLKVDNDGFVKEDRYAIKINVKNLLIEEFGPENQLKDKNLRIIRNTLGTYFITSDGFKNVYLFNQDIGGLKLSRKILVSETGLQNPYFNQRDSYIELNDGNRKINLSNDGIIGDKK